MIASSGRWKSDCSQLWTNFRARVSPVAAGSPAAAVASGPTATATLTTLQQRDAMLRQPNEYDSRAFGIAVLVGIGFAVAIYLFWRLVRPKPGERRK